MHGLINLVFYGSLLEKKDNTCARTHTHTPYYSSNKYVIKQTWKEIFYKCQLSKCKETLQTSGPKLPVLRSVHISGHSLADVMIRGCHNISPELQGLVPTGKASRKSYLN